MMAQLCGYPNRTKESAHAERIIWEGFIRLTTTADYCERPTRIGHTRESPAK